MTKMPDNIRKIMLEKSLNFTVTSNESSYKQGFQDCWEQMQGVVKALEIYGDKYSWRTNSGRVSTTYLTSGEDYEDIDGKMTGGKLARAALKELRGGG